VATTVLTKHVDAKLSRFLNHLRKQAARNDQISLTERLLWGAATAAYPVEGAWKVNERGESVWDRFSHSIGNVKSGWSGDITSRQKMLGPGSARALRTPAGEKRAQSIQIALATLTLLLVASRQEWFRVFPSALGCLIHNPHAARVTCGRSLGPAFREVGN
jgi:hypothetical protein